MVLNLLLENTFVFKIDKHKLNIFNSSIEFCRINTVAKIFFFKVPLFPYEIYLMYFYIILLIEYF